MITIQNEWLTARFQELGAELKSLQYEGREYIWGGDPAIWAGSCPVLFPICGALKEGTYQLDGESYSLRQHGFARNTVFTVESAAADEVSFCLQDNEETRALYPFAFCLTITYRLVEKALQVTYEVKNRDEKPLYFSIGSHEGYLCPEGIEEYEIHFPEAETLSTYRVVGGLVADTTQPVMENSRVLPLRYDYFDVDALIFKTHRSRSVQLRQKGDGRALQVTFEGCPYLLLWTKPGANAPYICIEPWCGIADSVHTDQNLKTKEGIQCLAPGETFTRTHKIEILK